MQISHFIELVQQMRNMQATHKVFPMANTKRRMRVLECKVDAEVGKWMRAVTKGERIEA